MSLLPIETKWRVGAAKRPPGSAGNPVKTARPIKGQGSRKRHRQITCATGQVLSAGAVPETDLSPSNGWKLGPGLGFRFVFTAMDQDPASDPVCLAICIDLPRMDSGFAIGNDRIKLGLKAMASNLEASKRSLIGMASTYIYIYSND